MTSEKELQINKHGWRAARILEAIELGSNTLKSIDHLNYGGSVLSAQVLENNCNSLCVDEFIVNNKW